MFKVEDGEEIIQDILKDIWTGASGRTRKLVEATKCVYDQLIDLPDADKIDFEIKDDDMDNIISVSGMGCFSSWDLRNYSAKKEAFKAVYKDAFNGIGKLD